MDIPEWGSEAQFCPEDINFFGSFASPIKLHTISVPGLSKIP